MGLPARVGLITLACADVDRMTRLLRDLGWPETPESDEHHRTFQCTNGVVIGLYAARHYEPSLGPLAAGFRGVVLSVNVSSFEECVALYEQLSKIDGVELLESPSTAAWGGGFSWRDPEGNVWDVAWAKEATLDARGGVWFP
jgi:uncharacterized glyoxalase superfamily protein PhnB